MIRPARPGRCIGTKPNGYLVKGEMYPAETVGCEQAMLKRIQELEALELGFIQSLSEMEAEAKVFKPAVERCAELEAKLLVSVPTSVARELQAEVDHWTQRAIDAEAEIESQKQDIENLHKHCSMLEGRCNFWGKDDE